MGHLELGDVQMVRIVINQMVEKGVSEDRLMKMFMNKAKHILAKLDECEVLKKNGQFAEALEELKDIQARYP